MENPRTNNLPITDYLHVKIASPTGVHLEENAESLTATNDTGEFDILPGHRSFITLLNACTINVKTTRGTEKTVEITSGVLHVKNNVVDVFLNLL